MDNPLSSDPAPGLRITLNDPSTMNPDNHSARPDTAILDSQQANSSSRRHFIHGFLGIIASMLFFPRWVWGQAVNVTKALREIYERNRNIPQLSLDAVAVELKKTYNMQCRIKTIGRHGGMPVQALEFSDGTVFHDGNGNGGLDVTDNELSESVDELLKKYEVTTSGRDGQMRIDLAAMKRAMPSLDHQRSYPFEETIQLFAQARTTSKEVGGNARERVKNIMEEFLSYQREESELRDRLETLRFVADNKQAVMKAIGEQERLIGMIRSLHEERALPLLRELAHFVRHGTWPE